MAQDGSYKIIIKAIDNTSAVVGKINVAFAKQSKGMMAINKSVVGMQKEFSRLGKITGVTALTKGAANLGRGLADAAKKASELVGIAGALGSMATIAGIAALINSTTNYNAALRNNAAYLGMSASELEKWQLANRLTGVSAETTTSTFESMSNAMHEALTTPNSESAQAFRLMGIDIQKSGYNALNAADRMLMLADAAQKLRKSGMDAASVAKILSAAGVGAGYMPALDGGSSGIKERMAKTAGMRSPDAGSSPLLEQQEMLKLRLETLGRSISTALTPSIKTLMDTIDPLLAQFNSWISNSEHQRDINDAIVASIKGIKTFVTETLPKINDFAQGMGGWGRIMKIAAVAVGAVTLALGLLNIVLISTPVGWIIVGITAAVAALAVAAYELYQHWDEVVKWFAPMMKMMKDNFWWIEPVLNALFPLGRAAYELYQHWDEVVKWSKTLWEGFSKTVVSIWQGVTKNFWEIWTPLASGFKKMWTDVSDFFLQIWDPIEKKLTAISDAIKAVIETAVKYLPENLRIKLGLSTPGDSTPANPGAAGSNPQGAGWQQRDIATLMQRYGLNKADATGMVANWQAESNGDDKRQQKDGPGYGIGQWEEPRQAEFKKYEGVDIRQATREQQMDFAVHEAKQRDLLGKSASGEEAGAYFSRKLEQPKDADGEARKRGEIAKGLGGGGVTPVAPLIGPLSMNGNGSNGTVNVNVNFDNLPKGARTNATSKGNTRLAMNRTAGSYVG